MKAAHQARILDKLDGRTQIRSQNYDQGCVVLRRYLKPLESRRFAPLHYLSVDLRRLSSVLTTTVSLIDAAIFFISTRELRYHKGKLMHLRHWPEHLWVETARQREIPSREVWVHLTDVDRLFHGPPAGRVLTQGHRIGKELTLYDSLWRSISTFGATAAVRFLT
jgi:hypothetical protein